MRDILFKAKRIDNGEWVEGAYFPKTKYPTKKNRTFIWVWQIGKIYCDYNCGYSPYEVDEKTICQYTGLTDKNGIKIYEGDIVKFEDCEMSTESGYGDCFMNIGSIAYDTDSMSYFITDRITVDMDDIDIKNDVEVIGNIFDNPELLNYVDNEVSQQAHQEVLKSATE